MHLILGARRKLNFCIPIVVKSSLLVTFLVLGEFNATPFVTAQAEAAEVCPICGNVKQKDQAPYPAKAGSTLARGAMNTFLGWTEMIRQPAEEVKAGGNVMNGIGKGVGQSVARTFSGIGEMLTFWTPKVQNRYLNFATDCPVCMGRPGTKPKTKQ